ncbi:MAG: hypothetical protein R3E13_11000 [Alphaproteobacteria bacterium]
MDTISRAPEGGTFSVQIECLKGFKSALRSWISAIEDMAEKGYSTTVSGFKSPDTRLNFLNRYRKLAKGVFCPEVLGIQKGAEQKHEKTNPDVLRVAAAHSLGGFLLTELLTNDETAERIRENYDAVVVINGFMGSKYANIPGRRLLTRLFPKTPVGTTGIERIFSSASAEYEPEELPTHAQGLLLDRAGAALVQKIQDQGGFSKKLQGMPILFITGNDDKVCNNKAVQKVAAITGAEVEAFNSVDHYAMGDKRVRDFITGWCNKLARDKKWEPYVKIQAEQSAHPFNHAAHPETAAQDVNWSGDIIEEAQDAYASLACTN